MKNIITILFLVTPLFLSAQYKSPTRLFGKGQIDVKAGVGVLSTYMKDNPQTVVPPVSLGADWFVANNISLGAYAGYSKSNSRPSEDLSYATNETFIADVRLGFHYTKIDRLNVYGGLSVGYQQVNITPSNPELTKTMENTGMKEQSSKMIYTGFVGTQYAISPRYSVFGELGYGISILRFGLGYRIK